jgi:SSS family solute:Na+ symporter
MPPAQEPSLLETNFGLVDWVIIVLYPCISLAVGLYARRLIKDMKTFVAADQSMGLWLGIASMSGSELGLITVMYSAEKGFNGGFATFHIALAAGITTFLVGFTGFIVYRLREMQVITIPEFYGKRFDAKTRLLGGILMAVGGILNMGLFLDISADFVTGVTGLTDSPWVSPTIMVLLSLLVLIYTSLGGMISIAISDYIQFVVLSFGMLLATVYLTMDLGWENIVETIQQNMGTKGFDPTIAEGEFGWQYMVWMMFLGLVSCGIWPTSVARALTAESPQVVKRQYMLSSISFLIRFLIPYFWGICAFVFIMHNEDLQALFFPAGYPEPAGITADAAALERTSALPIVLGKIVPAGLIGLVTAGMLAAFMSTQDTYLLCWASVLTLDVVAPICDKIGKPLSSGFRVTLTRIFIVAISLYVLVWGLFYKGGDDIWDYMAVTGAIYFTGAFAVLLGGLYWKQASSMGAFCALISGTGAILGLAPLRKYVEELFRTEFTSAGIGLFTIVLSLTVMIVVSLCFPDERTKYTRLARQTTCVVIPLACLLGVVIVNDYWMKLWTALLLIGVALFSVLAVVVTIGAAFDMKKLIALLSRDSDGE